MNARRRLLRMLTTRGVVRAKVCELCASLVLAEGAAQHERHHAVAGPKGGAR